MLRYNTFTRAIYTQYRGALNRGSAAVLGLVLVVLTIGVLAVEQRFRGREHVHRLHGGVAGHARVAHLGRWRWAALGACSALVGVALVVPMAVIGYWLWRGARVGEPLLPAGSLVVNSLRASALGAIATVAAAWPVALLSVRHPSRWSRIVERLSWSGHVLPGIVVALALVFFGAQRLPWAYQTMGMLVFGYMILFLPQAVGAFPRVAAPGHTVARRGVATARFRSGSDVRPDRAAADTPRCGGRRRVVFLTCMKELPATLLLAPTEFDTLATRVWTASSEAFLARAVAPALALVLFSSLPMAVLVLREAERRGQPVGKATADDPSILTPTCCTVCESRAARVSGIAAGSRHRA